MEIEQDLIDSGKIMQLHGLSAVKWNGSIVDVGEQSIENGIIRYACLIILGENKGKKIAIKAENLIEFPKPSSAQLKLAFDKFAKVSREFVSIRRANITRGDRIEKLIKNTNEIIELVPNCCILWQQLASYCKLVSCLLSSESLS